MKAVTYHQYGSPEVLQLEELPTPDPDKHEILIEVHAAPVTTADWRIRAQEMPGAMKIIGRLMFGIFAPRNKVLGVDVAGVVKAVGSEVTKFKTGDPVFGHIGSGGHAEFALANEKAAVVLKPSSLTFLEAAALPFGGLCALVFLRDFASLKAGNRVLIVGASGNVGVYAVQIAKALGAHVTAVASGTNMDLLESLGADEFVDYKEKEISELAENYDVIFDTFGALSFSQARKVLMPDGLFLPLNFSLIEAINNALFGWLHKQKMKTLVNGDSAEELLNLISLVEQGKVTPLIGKVFRIDEIKDAYRHVEGRHAKGAVILDMKGSTK